MGRRHVSQKEQQALEYWTGRAHEYSQLHMDSYVSEKRMVFAQQVALSIPPGEGLDALDLGCGSGFMSMILLDAGCKVTGIDFSKDMLERARENLAGKGYEAELLHMRAQQLDFPDESFDFIVSRNVTWMLEDVDTVYAEVMRVLKCGGVFLNIDANYGSCFNEADARGEVPTHPTQSLDQLRMRNDIARDLAITLVDRPLWDISCFWRLGTGEIRCRRVGEGQNVADSLLFAIEVHKPDAECRQADIVNALDTPSQLAFGDAVTRNPDEGKAKGKVMLVDFMRMGAFEFDPRKFVVLKNGTPIKFTPKEFNILLTLARNAGNVVLRERLKSAAWGSEFSGETDSLAVYVNHIRKKIEPDPSKPRYVLTHWGKGYSFDPHGGNGA